jgi:hypothetical protein
MLKRRASAAVLALSSWILAAGAQRSIAAIDARHPVMR